MIAKVLFWTTAAFLLAAIFLFLRLKAEIKKRDEYKREAKTNADKVKEMERILNLKNKEEKVRDENQKEADKKTAELFDGDAVDNAINGLRKR
mgnify:FL=1